MMFEISRLIAARKKRGLTQKALADAVGVTSRHFNSIENGDHPLSADLLAKIAKTLSFPVNFFSGRPVDPLPSEFVSFRAMSKMTAKQRDEALSTAQLSILVADWIMDKFSLPDVNVPDLRNIDPETAAVMVRQEWAMGDRPIPNLVHLLESKGVLLFSLTTEPKEIDAFCFWREARPFCLVNITKSSERTRFDIAHELGHLVLHRHGQPNGIKAEEEADKFAAAFLMPKTGLYSNTTSLNSIKNLIERKKFWNVSLAAFVHRLHKIQLLSDWQYHQLFIEISKRGFRTVEPESQPRESSQLLKKLSAFLRDDSKSLADIASDINVSTEDLNSLFFGLVLTALNGNGHPIKTNSRPNLRLVEKPNS